MPTQLWIQLIAQVGFQAATELIELWKRGGDLQPGDIDRIAKLRSIPGEAFLKGVVS